LCSDEVDACDVMFVANFPQNVAMCK